MNQSYNYFSNLHSSDDEDYVSSESASDSSFELTESEEENEDEANRGKLVSIAEKRYEQLVQNTSEPKIFETVLYVNGQQPIGRNLDCSVEDKFNELSVLQNPNKESDSDLNGKPLVNTLSSTVDLEFLKKSQEILKRLDAEMNQTITKIVKFGGKQFTLQVNLRDKTQSVVDVQDDQYCVAIRNALNLENSQEVTTLEKSKLDWNNVISTASNRETLLASNKSKDNILSRMEFLQKKRKLNEFTGRRANKT